MLVASRHPASRPTPVDPVCHGSVSRDRAPGNPSDFSLQPSASRRPSRPAFTLVELLVVIGIIILVLAIAVPAVGPMLASNEQAALVNTINGMLVKAQARASNERSGLRLERAYATNDQGLMVDRDGDTPDDGAAFDGPIWLDHQQVRIVTYNPHGNDFAFRQAKGTEPFPLPEGAWVAPSYVLDPAIMPSLAEDDLTYRYDPGVSWRELNRMDTFYVMFENGGELISAPGSLNTYLDARQHEDALVRVFSGNPTDPNGSVWPPSTLSLLVYDRSEFNEIDPDDSVGRRAYLAANARPIYINRATGALIEEPPQ